MQLGIQLAAATGMVALTVTIHLAGIAILLVFLRRRRERRADRRGLVHEAIAVVGAAAGLFALHAAEIWCYALLYLLVGALGTLESALYFSTASYTTVGYGDVVLGIDWRVFGAIESANGIILLGWSTAFFVAIVGRIRWIEAEVQELT